MRVRQSKKAKGAGRRATEKNERKKKDDHLNELDGAAERSALWVTTL